MITLSGHTDAVGCVAAADDGHVLTGSVDKTVKVWAAQLRAHHRGAHKLRLCGGGAAGGASFVSGSQDKT